MATLKLKLPECPICYQKFSFDSYSLQIPKQLSCGHSFCLECCRSLPETLTDHGFKLVSCPQCRKSTTIEIKAGFVTNFALVEYLTAQEQEAKAAAQVKKLVLLEVKEAAKCGNCDLENAENHCTVCNADICSTCWSQIHASKLFQSHQKISVAEARREARKQAAHKCAEHAENNSLYCLSCNILMCVLCRDYGSHKSHSVELVENVYENFKTVLEGKAARLEKLNVSMKQTVEKQAETIERLHESAQVTRKLVAIGVKTIQDAVERRGKVLQDEISELEAKSINEVIQRSEALNELYQHGQKTFEKSQLLLMDADEREFLANYRTVLEAIQSLFTSSEKCLDVKNSKSAIALSFNVEALISRLEKFGAVSATSANVDNMDQRAVEDLKEWIEDTPILVRAAKKKQAKPDGSPRVAVRKSRDNGAYAGLLDEQEPDWNI
jgi:hypothetical protein